MASWLAGDNVLCSWARHLTLTVPLSTREYKWEPNKLRGNDMHAGGWASIPSRGSRNTPSHFMLLKPGIRYGSYEPVGSTASFSFNLFNAYSKQCNGPISVLGVAA